MMMKMMVEKTTMSWLQLFYSIIFLCCCCCSCHLCSAQPTFSENGAKCLFAGHSFFIPVARIFDVVASSHPLFDGEFEDHSLQHVFRGGPNGSPMSLWENEKEEIENILAQGDIDVFGLTVSTTTGAEPDELIAPYRLWIDLALQHNEKTSFLIAVPWASEGPTFTPQNFRVVCNILASRYFGIVQTLRSEYPDNAFYMINYAIAASTMYTLFDEGGLQDDVTNVLGPSDTSLFTDESPGHAGQMLKEMSGLLFLNTLYGIPTETLIQIATTDSNNIDDAVGRSYDVTSVTEILTASVAANEVYRYDFQDPPTTNDDMMMSPSSSPSAPSTGSTDAPASSPTTNTDGNDTDTSSSAEVTTRTGIFVMMMMMMMMTIMMSTLCSSNHLIFW